VAGLIVGAQLYSFDTLANPEDMTIRIVANAMRRS
jgi:hypothetical protein